MMTGPNALRLIVAAMLIFAPSLMAAAAPRVTAKYVYFNAAGTTDAQLFTAVRAHGPVVSGKHAFARTRMKASVSAKMMRKGRRCAIRKVDFHLKFIIAVPRAAQKKRFSRALSHRWRKFRKHLVWHEKRHCAIWLKCARAAERRIKRLTAASCVSLNRRMKAEYHKAMRKCDALHAAFDLREQRGIMRDPFVRAALGLARSRRASR